MHGVSDFNYMEVMMSTDGGIGEELAHKVFKGRKVWGRWKSCGRESCGF